MYAGVVLGGMGSILGAFWGGLTVGLVQQISTLVLPHATAERGDLRRCSFSSSSAAARAVRPLGGADVSRGRPRRPAASRLRRSRSSHSAGSPSGSRSATRYYQLMMTLVPIWAVLGLSWNMLSGYTGLVSFGHASFFGLGAYTVTLRWSASDLTPWFGIPLAMLVGVAAALAHRLSDLPPARALFRAGDARLSARPPLRLRVARLSGSAACR